MKIAYIPARSGSKRFPNKNITILNGKPLIVWTIEAFIKSNCFDKVFFSSDSDKYFELVDKFIQDNKLYFHKRTREQAGDKVKIFDYIKNNINLWAEEEDLFAMGLPTCPFRNHIHVKSCVELSIKFNKPVFSACEFINQVPFAFSIDDNNRWLPALKDSPLLTGNTRSQDQKKYFRPNGGVYIIKPKFLKKVKTFYEDAIPYFMSAKDSLDIDNKEDFDYAEFLLKNS